MTKQAPPSSTSEPAIEAISDVVGFWDRRHRQESLLRSGGHISRTETENLAFYYRRLGLILESLGGIGGQASRARLLDAGCGKGVFAEWLDECGFSVTAVDSSRSAVAAAADRSAGNVTYVHAKLEEFTAWPPFEAVISIDVLFHIVDDGEWEQALKNIASLVAPGGTLVVSGACVDDAVSAGSYIRYRPSSDYESTLIPMGFSPAAFLPYGSAKPVTGLRVFRRG